MLIILREIAKRGLAQALARTCARMPYAAPPAPTSQSSTLPRGRSGESTATVWPSYRSAARRRLRRPNQIKSNHNKITSNQATRVHSTAATAPPRPPEPPTPALTPLAHRHMPRPPKPQSLRCGAVARRLWQQRRSVRVARASAHRRHESAPRNIKSHKTSRDIKSHKTSRDIKPHTTSRDIKSHTTSRGIKIKEKNKFKKNRK